MCGLCVGLREQILRYLAYGTLYLIMVLSEDESEKHKRDQEKLS